MKAGRSLGVFAITLCCLALAIYYVSSERTFYSWDYAVYYDIATQLRAAFQLSTATGWATFEESLTKDQTALFALPLIPVFHVFGESRVAFIGGLTVLYLVPMSLVIGSLAKRLAGGNEPAVFWTGAVIVALQPATWVPTLRGFPDVGAAALVAFALLAQFDKRHPLRALGSGFLLGLAVLFRRHFLFALPAFGLTLAMVVLTDRAGGSLWKRCGATARELALVAVGLLSVLLTIGLPFTKRVVRNDFFDLYSGYLNPPSVTGLWFLSQYGWLFLSLALAGFVAGYYRGVVDRRWTLVILTFFGVSFLQWIFIVRQLGEQYFVHFTPVIALGLTAAACTLARAFLSGRTKRLACIAGSALLLSNLMLGLSNLKVAFSSYPGRGFFSANWAPLLRSDYDEVRRLAAFLRNRPAKGDICVIGSSLVFNWSVLQAADQLVRDSSDPPLNIVNMPDLDSRDRYPLGPLLQAEYVLLVRPLQLHLPGKQLVVRAAYNLFATPTRFAADFEQLKRGFALSDGLVVDVFRRLRQTPVDVSLDALRTMQASVNETPGTQPDWEVLSSNASFWTTARGKGVTELVAHPELRGMPQSMRALYLPSPSPLSRVSGQLTFVDARCKGVAIRFSGLTAEGAFRDVEEVVRLQGDASRFEVEIPLRPGEQLALSLTNPADQPSLDFCLSIVSLTVPPQ